jgi:hypothetical protein
MLSNHRGLISNEPSQSYSSQAPHPLRTRAMTTRRGWAGETLGWNHKPRYSLPFVGVLFWATLLLIPSTAGAVTGSLEHRPISAPRAVTVASAQSSLSWNVLNPTTRPQGVSGAMMAYDAADGYVVLFGGLNATACTNQTWKYLAGSWTQLHPRISPPARCDGMMAYDAKDHFVVLYGGLNAVYYNDTWTFAGGQWTQVHPSTDPGPLAFGSATYDPLSRSILLFGGDYDPCSCATYISTGLYSFSKGSWTLKPSHLRPSGSAKILPGANSAVAFDPIDGYLVEFGGWNHASKNSTTWNYSHSRWTRQNPTTSPEWLISDCLAFDPKLGYVVMFGGYDMSTSNSPNATWEYLGGSWTRLHTAHSPPGEAYPAASTYDGADHYFLLFGGQNISSSVPSNNTWVLR